MSLLLSLSSSTLCVSSSKRRVLWGTVITKLVTGSNFSKKYYSVALTHWFSTALSVETMKKSITLLLYCLYFLGSYFCNANKTSLTIVSNSHNPNQTENSSSEVLPVPNTATHLLSTTEKPTVKPKSSSYDVVAPSLTTAPADNSIDRNLLFIIVAGGLILLCIIFLISTLLLACKVCQLSRHIKMLSGHSDLMTTAKSWKESSEKDNNSETDAKETTVLMSNVTQTCDEAGDGGNQPNTESVKVEKETVFENGVEQKENCAKNEEVKETSAAVTGNSSSPQEEGTNSQTNQPEENAATEDKKDTKDGE